MNSLVLLIICVAILVAGYVCYGGWLCKQWGVGENKTETPAHTMEDGVDYVPAKAPVLMGHHFSSIAGAGPITGPIGAAMFGWLPVTLWILVGGIFFGGVHDFGALFASVRNKGQSIGEIISANMSKRAKQLFIIFSYLTLILVVAAFASIVASTFGAVYDESGAVDMVKSTTPATVAMISILFILIAIVFGFCVYRRNMPMSIASVVGVLAVLTLCAIGYAYKWNAANPDSALVGATAIFGGGIAHMIDDIIPGSYTILNSLLVLTYSAFCLTSLDTATRLARFMFQEFWLEPGETAADVKEGWKKVMVNPYFATILTVVLGILLGMNGYGKIWGLFGAANQLLAGIGLLAVATWLGNLGKNNKMFLLPMGFMIVVTICSLALTVKNQVGMIMAGGADWGPWAQTILGVLLIVLAIVLVIEGVQTLKNPKKATA